MAKNKAAAAAAEDPAMEPAGPMRVVVTVAFSGAPDGTVYPREFAPGDVVEGDLAAVALREGWAESA